MNGEEWIGHGYYSSPFTPTPQLPIHPTSTVTPLTTNWAVLHAKQLHV